MSFAIIEKPALRRTVCTRQSDISQGENARLHLSRQTGVRPRVKKYQYATRSMQSTVMMSSRLRSRKIRDSIMAAICCNPILGRLENARRLNEMNRLNWSRNNLPNSIKRARKWEVLSKHKDFRLLGNTWHSYKCSSGTLLQNKWWPCLTLTDELKKTEAALTEPTARHFLASGTNIISQVPIEQCIRQDCGLFHEQVPSLRTDQGDR